MKILSICGSPRKGNSEAIALKIQALLKEKGVENEIILLREKSIKRCLGCVEFCNEELKCQIQDGMQEIMDKMEKADGFVFICPNYFNMPTGLFKDYIDRCSVLFTAGKQDEFAKKKAVVVVVGGDKPEAHETCLDNIAGNFCEIVGMKVVGRKGFQGNSELKGNCNDIFESGLNPNILKDLQGLVDSVIS